MQLFGLLLPDLDPGVANVASGVTYQISGGTLVGTLLSTDPGRANVVNGITYTINSVAKTGTYVPPAVELGGNGPNATVLTITADGANPVISANCWVTSDALGASPVTGVLQSDINGNVTFNLTTGTTYYLWAEANGYRAAGTQFTA